MSSLLEWGSSISGGYYAVYIGEDGKTVSRVYAETYNDIRKKISSLGMKADRALRWEHGNSPRIEG